MMRGDLEASLNIMLVECMVEYWHLWKALRIERACVLVFIRTT